MSVSEEFWEVDKPGNFNNKEGRYMKKNMEEDRAYSGEEIERIAENVKTIKSVIRGRAKLEMTPEEYAEFVAECERREEAERVIAEDAEEKTRVTVNPYADNDRVHVDELRRLEENMEGLRVKINPKRGKEWVAEDELIAVTRPGREALEDAEDIAAAREARKEPGRIPIYYLMPNFVEVKEIARYLTSNGGQALQYIARSCRIDGITKGEPIRDLEKARDMIDDEINRLKEEQ